MSQRSVQSKSAQIGTFTAISFSSCQFTFSFSSSQPKACLGEWPAIYKKAGMLAAAWACFQDAQTSLRPASISW
jgi:hypothetical protein